MDDIKLAKASTIHMQMCVVFLISTPEFDKREGVLAVI